MRREKGFSLKTWVIIGLLFLLTIISNADKAIIGFSSTQLMEELGLTATQWGLVGSSFFFLYSLSAIVVGGIADKIGVRKVIAVMAIVWALVQFATIFVSNYVYLVITRIILGAGEGPSYSLAMTAAAKWLPKNKLGIGLTLVSIGGPVGVAVSAPILIGIITSYGWRAAFITTGIVGIIWTIGWLIFSKNEPAQEEAVSIAVVEKTNTSTFKEFLLSKNFFFIALCGFGTYWSFTIGLNWLPNYLETVRQIDESVLGWVVSLPWILIACSQLFFSFLSDKIYYKTKNILTGRVFILGPVLALSGVFYILGTLFTSNILTVAFLSIGLSFGCLTLVLGPAILSDLVDKKHQGKIQGWFMAITSLGGIAGPFITGKAVEMANTTLAGFHIAFYICGIVLMVCGVCAALLIRPKKEAVIANSPELQST
ncbi:MFS transporter [Ureibacillus composti]